MTLFSAYRYRAFGIALLIASVGCHRGAYTQFKSGNLQQIDSSETATVARIDSIIAPYRNEITDRVKDTVGYLDHEMVVKKPESELGNILADFLMEYSPAVDSLKPDMAIFNTGGFRIPLPGGAITERHILELMPFDNTVVLVKLSGSKMMQLAEQICKAGGDPISNGTYVFCNTATPFIVIDKTPIDSTQSYVVMTSSYLAEGGDGYSAFINPLAHYDTGVLVRDVLRKGFLASTTAANPAKMKSFDRIKKKR